MDTVASETVIEKATAADAAVIRDIVIEAYSKYVDRIGKQPAPMTEDYDQLVASQDADVFVLRVKDRVVGAIVLSRDGQSLKINNLVVSSAAQGRGYGRDLMNHAQDSARKQGLSALTLFTNIKMYENLAYYSRLGFSETDRRTEDGFERVFFRKDLS